MQLLGVAGTVAGAVAGAVAHANQSLSLGVLSFAD
jgi:hypothetical protein